MMLFADIKYLILLISIPFMLFIARSKSGFMGLSKKRILLIKIFRSFAVTLLILAIAGLSIKSLLEKKTVIFVVDRSDSVNKKSFQKAMDLVRTSVERSKPDDKVGLIYFGSDVRIETMPSMSKGITSTSVIDTKATNIEEALQTAITLFPPNSMKRIVLISDGNSNRGDVDKAIKLANLANVEIDVMQLEALGSNEVLALSLDIPGKTRLNEAFAANAYIESDNKTNANIVLTKQGQVIDFKNVNLDAGVNKVDFSLIQKDIGFSAYEVRVEAPNDNFTQNNIARNTTLTEDAAKILYVSRQANPGIKRAIESSKMDVDVIEPSYLEGTELKKYSVIVLENIPYSEIGSLSAEKIEKQVKSAGGGLIVIGGDRSYGPGGYADTSLENILPVKMDVPARKRSPSIAEVLVIDKSGSMGSCHCGGGQNQGSRAEGGMNKVELSKSAALKASHALTSNDFFGVVATDKEAFWPHPLVKTGKLNPKVGSLVADGETNIFQGIMLAYNSLIKLAAATKHIILITDGWTDLVKLSNFTSTLKKEKISLSIVAAGEGSTKELSDIAESAGGRYYPMEDASKIPEIVASETNTALRPFINEKLFYPKAASTHRIIDSLRGKSRQLKGYIVTTLKSSAERALVSDENDPVLASWQYGLGRVVAWTSDGGERWAGNWVSSENISFWNSMVRYVLPQKSSREIRASFVRDGRNVIINAAVASNDPSIELNAMITSPEGQTDQIKLKKEASGKFSAITQADEEGVYNVKIDALNNGRNVMGEQFSFVASYPTEYLYRTANKFLLNKISENTKGIFIGNAKDIFDRPFRALYDRREIWRQLTVIALILFFTDILLRKVTTTRKDIADMKNNFLNRIKRHGPETHIEKSPVIERLNKAKKRALKDL